jgi:hypothetical protein
VLMWVQIDHCTCGRPALLHPGVAFFSVSNKAWAQQVWLATRTKATLFS